MKFQKGVSIAIAIGLMIAASIWYGMNNHLLPVAAAAEALVYDRLFNTMLGIAFGVFLLIESLLVFSVLVFRQRAGDMEDGPAIEENLRLEILWTAIPIVIVLWLSIYSTLVYNTMVGKESMAGMISHHSVPQQGTTLASMTTMDDPATEVEVTAMQFAWLFNYPGTDITTAELHIPVGQKVRLNLHAADVIHAFWVPELRLKQDTIPGMTTYLEFNPSRMGTYTIVCTELCGSYHGGMRAEMIIESPADYANWLKEQQSIAQAGISTIALTPGQEYFAETPHGEEAHHISSHLSIAPGK